jgi:hypothetical protein
MMMVMQPAGDPTAHKEKTMQKNVGNADKVIRVVVGLGLLSLLFLLNGSMKWIGLIGIVPIGTALMGFCPLYAMLGIRTCPMKN